MLADNQEGSLMVSESSPASQRRIARIRTWQIMKKELENTNESKTKDLHVNIPLRLAKRMRIAAEENDTTITNMVIEALDDFLRKQEKWRLYKKNWSPWN